MTNSAFVHKYLLFVVIGTVVFIRIYPKLENYITVTFLVNSTPEPVFKVPPFLSINYFIYLYIYFNIYHMYCNLWLLLIETLSIIIDTISSYCGYVAIYKIKMATRLNNHNVGCNY